VVGGGITGITTAYLLKQAGYTVALVERDRCASIDSGHTTALLIYVTNLKLLELVHYFDNDHARAVWDAGKAAMQQIEDLSKVSLRNSGILLRCKTFLARFKVFANPASMYHFPHGQR
jgi:glycine/D-amino acid oxidase-like deaminating enzyme